MKAKYLSYVRTIAEKSLDWKKLEPVIVSAHQLIAVDVAEDTRKLESTQAFEAAMSTQAVDGNAAPMRGMSLRAFIEKRQAYLLSHPEVAKATAVSLPEKVREQPKAKEAKVTASDKPVTSSSATSGKTVIINELMASNTKTAKDPQGQFDDWIELANVTDKPIALDGMYLTDTDRAPRKWQFPAGTMIPARGYLVLWCDEDAKSKDGLHVNFKLSSGGEELYLVDRDDRNNAVVDQIRFGKQADDVSFGRHPATPDKLVPLAPTIGTSNKAGE